MHGQNGLSFSVDPRYSLGWKYRVNRSDTPWTDQQTRGQMDQQTKTDRYSHCSIGGEDLCCTEFPSGDCKKKKKKKKKKRAPRCHKKGFGSVL